MVAGTRSSATQELVTLGDLAAHEPDVLGQRRHPRARARSRVVALGVPRAHEPEGRRAGPDRHATSSRSPGSTSATRVHRCRRRQAAARRRRATISSTRSRPRRSTISAATARPHRVVQHEPPALQPLPGAGRKTGFISEAGYCVATWIRAEGRDLIARRARRPDQRHAASPTSCGWCRRRSLRDFAPSRIVTGSVPRHVT